MPHNPMLNLFNAAKERNPELSELMDLFSQAYQNTSMLKTDIDFHFLHYPPGHYYSPVPSLEWYNSAAQRVYKKNVELLGIDLNEREQLKTYARLSKYYDEIPFADEKKPYLRYYYNNNIFCYADVYWLYSLIRDIRPQKIIEIGSGFSSAVMLDTDELFCDNSIDFTFIEPYPDRLNSLLKVADKNHELHKDIVQNVDIKLFRQLQKGDFLFVDSSHVGKFGSDVLYILHEILPLLNQGVIIHFHDIFYPFEYPRQWLEENGWAWNECYFIRSFLQYNSEFKIKLFGNYLGQQHVKMLAKYTPLCLKNIGGSLWLEKSNNYRNPPEKHVPPQLEALTR
jgi:predicted O-methyltransferase YrrM